MPLEEKVFFDEVDEGIVIDTLALSSVDLLDWEAWHEQTDDFPHSFSEEGKSCLPPQGFWA